MPRQTAPKPVQRTRHTQPAPGPRLPETFRFTDFAMI